MKRRLLSLITLFAITFCFVNGCKNETGKETAILIKDGKEIVATINGVDYTADQVYGDLINSNSSAEYLYEELEDLLIKTAVNVTDSMRSRIVNEVEKWKKDIKEDATISGTSYDESLANALAEEGVSSEEELIEKKIFALQEEILKNQYLNNTEEQYYNEYLNSRYVYHISQILVSISTNGNYDYFYAKPSSSAAEKIYNVVNSLLEGESFYNVALRYSDDSSSKNNGGDLGIVTLNDTSIPAEVRYALSSYSYYLENADEKENGGAKYYEVPEYLDEVYGNGIEAIPQKYMDLLGEIYDDSTRYITDNTHDFYERVYGRTIIFNNLFNTKTFRFIQSDGDVNTKEMNNIKMPLTDVVGFENSSVENVLVNKEGYPILVVRSDSGIHFISITKSAFINKEEVNAKTREEELAKYYSKEIDYTDDYKTYLEKAVDENDKEARLSKLESFSNEYAIMKVSGNTEFAGNESFIRYDMFKYYLNGTFNGVKFEIKDKNIEKIVLQYINAKKEYVQQKIKNVFSGNYELHSNLAEYSDTSLIKKEIPVLSCLEKDSQDKYMCKYTYKEGFKSTSSGGDN